MSGGGRFLNRLGALFNVLSVLKFRTNTRQTDRWTDRQESAVSTT